MINENDVLTASCRDYCESKCKSLSGYELKGVMAEGDSLKNALEKLVRIAPKNTEVITDLILSQEGHIRELSTYEGRETRTTKVSSEYNLMGVCLIPRAEEK